MNADHLHDYRQRCLIRAAELREMADTAERDYGAPQLTIHRADFLKALEVALPAVISVGDAINEPRYPSFKGIMAAKKKPVELAKAGLLKRSMTAA